MKKREYSPFKSPESEEKFLRAYDEEAKAWPVQSESKMINTSYGNTYVRISGSVDAPPLVLLHGMNSNSLMWLPNIEDLSKYYRTYAVDDINGNGRSIATKTLNDVNDFNNWLDELFDALKLGDNINLVGMSYGGWQASQYALKFPNKINKLVLLAPAATVLKVSSKFTVLAIVSLIPMRYFYKSLMYWVMEDAVKKDEKTMEKTVNFMYFASKCFKMRQPVAPTVLDDTELKSMEMPVLYMVGENEKIYSATEAVNRIKNVTPQIKTEIIPNAGHDLTSVQNEMIDHKILEFLK